MIDLVGAKKAGGEFIRLEEPRIWDRRSARRDRHEETLRSDAGLNEPRRSSVDCDGASGRVEGPRSEEPEENEDEQGQPGAKW